MAKVQTLLRASMKSLNEEEKKNTTKTNASHTHIFKTPISHFSTKLSHISFPLQASEAGIYFF